jgi:type I restriction enzyme M protein
MDDMDQLSVDQGGKPSFFRGEFEKYSWSSIFNRRLGGQEILNLYGEALSRMDHNPNIPQLFRDIFKNAFLPYRDSETLRLFLKEISGFTYDHSERLGDAFEYLLSVLSSQGEAGQFRTPRHIIDFIVEIVAPQKHETVLDPACGTAGFLISAYKHILKNNPKLSTSQKQHLMNNFVGYDISADMVRLSLVNMYLHGFPQPHIHEYDTLTYEDHWQDTFDVIMANPPFMSPKGGIRPHSRFSIKAKRSEVLFVDYIAEHLNPGGRAGVIVPEGIIFQSQNAYKALRKMLVENYLWAVVYSGVKTSILLLDKSLAKRIDKILFVKIENDGLDLGAQRRPIDKNDLPPAQKCLNIYKSKIINCKSGKTPSPTPSLKKKLQNPSITTSLETDTYKLTIILKKLQKLFQGNRQMENTITIKAKEYLFIRAKLNLGKCILVNHRHGQLKPQELLLKMIF